MSDGQVSRARRAALVSDDLLFASQLNAALAAHGGGAGLVSGRDLPDAEVIFVDLNQRPEERIEVIARLRARDAQARIVGFCHHQADEVRRQAMAAGADQVVNNGALQAVALRLAGSGAAPRG